MNIWAAILVIILSYLWGRRVGQGKWILYIGTNEEKYKKALFGIYLKK